MANQLAELTVSILASRVRQAEGNLRNINHSFVSHENSPQVLMNDLEILRSMIEERAHRLALISAGQIWTSEEIQSLGQQYSTNQIHSFDGTSIWTIIDVQRKSGRCFIGDLFGMST